MYTNEIIEGKQTMNEDEFNNGVHQETGTNFNVPNMQGNMDNQPSYPNMDSNTYTNIDNSQSNLNANYSNINTPFGAFNNSNNIEDQNEQGVYDDIIYDFGWDENLEDEGDVMIE